MLQILAILRRFPRHKQNFGVVIMSATGPAQRFANYLGLSSPILISVPMPGIVLEKGFSPGKLLAQARDSTLQAAAVCFSVHLSRTRKLRLHPCVKCFMARMIALFVSFRGCCLTTHRLRLLSPQSQMNGSSYVQHLLQRPLSRSCACRSL